MAFYGSEELARKLVRKEIEAKRDFVAKAPLLCDVVRKFDGKVFNKRLETAMREVMHVVVNREKPWGWLEIIGYVDDRMVQSDIADKYGHRDCGYIKDDRIYMVSCAKDCIDEDGRIIAENICKRIYDEMARQKKYADNLEDQLDRISEIKADCERIRKEREKFVWETNAQIREYFNLEV